MLTETLTRSTTTAAPARLGQHASNALKSKNLQGDHTKEVNVTPTSKPDHLTWGPQEEPDQADVLALQQESAQLGKAIADLPDKQRELIVQAYYGELTHSEIADATGLPLGTIKSRIRLALDRLRHQLK